MAHVPLTRVAHDALAARLSSGALAVDATAGNGHDTLFLAATVGEPGHVWAFDVQQAALEATRERLCERQLQERCTLLHASHADMMQHLPPSAIGAVRAVVFNLGYLPGSDKKCVTTANTTLPALTVATELMAVDGLLSIMVYRGHSGGEAEARAVQKWLAQSTLQVETHRAPGQGPVLYLARHS